jgi:hypothetical protein
MLGKSCRRHTLLPDGLSDLALRDIYFHGLTNVAQHQGRTTLDT